jgi:hypothetical protein
VNRVMFGRHIPTIFRLGAQPVGVFGFHPASAVILFASFKAFYVRHRDPAELRMPDLLLAQLAGFERREPAIVQ